MNALVRTGECEAALEVFREMIRRKLKPGLVTCNFILTNCSKHRKGEVALAFLDIMKKVHIRFGGRKGLGVFGGGGGGWGDGL